MNIENTTTRAQILEAFGVPDITSVEMRAAIHDWYNLYYDGERLPEEDPAQRLGYTIVAKLTRTAFSEYGASTTKTGDQFCAAVLSALDRVKKTALQQSLIGGESWLKPYPTRTGWKISVLRRDRVFVFGRDGDGIPVDVGSIETTRSSTHWYNLLERRTVDAAGFLRIQNMLYMSDNADMLGARVPLSSLPRYAELLPDYIFPVPLYGLGMAYIKTPLENTVDGSPDGVSIYAPAAEMIHTIDHNEWLMSLEYDNARSRVFASADLVKKDEFGRRSFSGSLFVGLDGDPEDVGVTTYSPAIRTQSFEERKQSALRSIESIIGLKRGLLSEVEAVERTATEITSSAGDYNLSIMDIQDMWTRAVKEVVRICGILGVLYHVPGAHETDPEEVVLDYGNGVLYDEEKTWADYLDLVARGLLKPEIALGWRFGMPTETESDLQKVREKYMPASQTEGGDD